MYAIRSYYEKIAQYREEAADLDGRLEEQLAMLEELGEQKGEVEHAKQQIEAEVDSLKSQLADYQQALDVQQTRAIQYRQAILALDKARELCVITSYSIHYTKLYDIARELYFPVFVSQKA